MAIKLAYGGTVDAATLLAVAHGLSVPFYVAIGGSRAEMRRRGRPLP